MAMNKKEKAYVEKLEILAALRHTDGAEEDVLPPESCVYDDDDDELTKGYTFNSYAKRVDESCSSFMSHSKHKNTKATSEGSISMFSTKTLAYKAMRKDIELRCARELRAIDLLIEASEGWSIDDYLEIMKKS